MKNVNENFTIRFLFNGDIHFYSREFILILMIRINKNNIYFSKGEIIL